MAGSGALHAALRRVVPTVDGGRHERVACDLHAAAEVAHVQQAATVDERGRQEDEEPAVAGREQVAQTEEPARDDE